MIPNIVLYFYLGMNSQNETPNFVNLLEDTYEYMMETSNVSGYNNNPSPSQVESTKKPKTRQANFAIEEDFDSYIFISRY